MNARPPLIVTNVLSHYRKPLFRLLATSLDARFLFFSDGGEWYWRNGNASLDGIPGEILPGRWVGGTRVTPGLFSRVARGEHGVVVKCINGKFALPTTWAAARMSQRPFVLWTGLWQHPQGLVHTATRRTVERLYRSSDALLTYGRHVSQHVIDAGADPRHVFEAPQAVDLDRFSIDDRVSRSNRSILFVGRLEPDKGPMVLLRALAELRQRGEVFNARIIGAGSLAGALAQAIRDRGLSDAVELLGQVPNEALPDHYRSASVTVVPSVISSRFAEPWSLAVNEAMGCGSVVVTTTAVGAARDGLVQDGVTGRVVPEGDAASLASVLAALLASPRERSALAMAAHERVHGYSYDAAVESFGRAIRHAEARRAGARTA